MIDPVWDQVRIYEKEIWKAIYAEVEFVPVEASEYAQQKSRR